LFDRRQLFAIAAQTAFLKGIPAIAHAAAGPGAEGDSLALGFSTRRALVQPEMEARLIAEQSIVQLRLPQTQVEEQSICQPAFMRVTQFA